MGYAPVKKKNSGGKRKGAGRKTLPPKEYSDDFKYGIITALEKKAKLEGKTVYDLFADKMYGKRINDLVFCSLLKILAGVMVVKETKETINVHEVREVIMLPPIQEPKVIDIKKEPV